MKRITEWNTRCSNIRYNALILSYFLPVGRDVNGAQPFYLAPQ